MLFEYISITINCLQKLAIQKLYLLTEFKAYYNNMNKTKSALISEIHTVTYVCFHKWISMLSAFSKFKFLKL